MNYDRLYKKTGDRQEAIRRLKNRDTLILILFILLFPAAVFLTFFLIFGKNMNVFLVVIISAAAVILMAADYAKKRKNGYKYVHLSRDVKRYVAKFEEKAGIRGKSFDDLSGGFFSEGRIFRYTLDNEARVKCDFEDGVYTFTVQNDEWDDVASYTSGEEDFGSVLKTALRCAASLEKLPDGEYDENAGTADPDEEEREESDGEN